jgi:hypothetical protein
MMFGKRSKELADKVHEVAALARDDTLHVTSLAERHERVANAEVRAVGPTGEMHYADGATIGEALNRLRVGLIAAGAVPDGREHSRRITDDPSSPETPDQGTPL